MLAQVDLIEADPGRRQRGPAVETAVLAEGQGHVLGQRHRVEQGRALEHHPDPAPDRVEAALAELIDAAAVEPDLAAIDLEQADQVLDRHRLADARRPDDEQDLALADVEIHALQHRLAVEGLADVDEADQRRHRLPPSSHSAPTESVKSIAITANEPPTTAAVVAQPTPSDEPRARRPQNPATIGIAAP